MYADKRKQHFLEQSFVLLRAALFYLILAGVAGALAGEEKTGQSQRPQAKPINAPAVAGAYYEVDVPDTLDLAERSRLGLNHFMEIIDQNLDYEMYMHAHFDSPPRLENHVTALGACQAKAMEAMCFQRLMCGSLVNLEREAKMIEMMVSMLGADGLHWVKADIRKKPWMIIPEAFAMVHGQGRMMRAMAAWYQYTGGPAWKKRIDRMVDGLEKIVVHKDDYAYIPTHGFYPENYMASCYTAKGWKETTEPNHEKEGEEGSLFNHSGHIAGVLANWYLLTGNEKALQLSGELVRFYTKAKFWADWPSGEYPGVAGPEHAHWNAHFHGTVNTLRAILEYAIAANDTRLKQFVRDGYEWARQGGCARIGYFGIGCWDDPQGCATGRMIGLAVKLSDAGVGDYWEDVDQYIRNEGTERQIVPEDKDYLWSFSRGKAAQSQETGKNSESVIDKVMGGFGGRPRKEQCFSLCCGTHGNMGLFYAWDGTLRYQDGTARINLLLNRASPWVDIDSYLPYEGKVVIKNKAAREAFVRIPLWIDRSAVRCRLRNQEVSIAWLGNYLRFRDLKPDDVLTIQFPIAETKERWTIPISGAEKTSQVHDCWFKGNTLIEMSPPLVPGANEYQRTYYRKDKAPMKKVTRFVTPVVLKW